MAKACCAALAACQTFNILLPGTPGYNTTEASYFSLQEAALLPSCITQPHSSKQAAEMVTVLTQHDACKNDNFAIKSGTHAPAAGFANIDGGVTIDLSGLNSVSLNNDHSIAHVGSGNRWVDVYAALDPYGKSVAGGRNGAVGVGGLTLGGGISYFSPQVGFTCDTVQNFELVSASGELINANAQTNSDLFRALKGGTNNFGLVTRFDFATVDISKILGGSISNNITYRSEVFKAFANIAGAENYDVHASVVMGLLYNATAKSWSLSSTPIYTLPETQPKVYQELFAVPNITAASSLNLVKLHVFSNETPLPPLNWEYYTSTYDVSANLLNNIFDILNDTLYDFDIPEGIAWSFAFEPLPTVFLAPGAGKNSLGTSPADGNSIILLMSALWPDSSSNSKVHAKALEAMDKVNAAASEKGMLKSFQYTNYADYSQHPIERYGSANVKFLQQTAKKYDPKGVFQHKVPGGFKLPSS